MSCKSSVLPCTVSARQCVCCIKERVRPPGTRLASARAGGQTREEHTNSRLRSCRPHKQPTQRRASHAHPWSTPCAKRHNQPHGRTFHEGTSAWGTREQTSSTYTRSRKSHNNSKMYKFGTLPQCALRASSQATLSCWRCGCTCGPAPPEQGDQKQQEPASQVHRAAAPANASTAAAVASVTAPARRTACAAWLGTPGGAASPCAQPAGGAAPAGPCSNRTAGGQGLRQ